VSELTSLFTHQAPIQGDDMSTSIALLANGYLEIICMDPWAPPLCRHYVVRRTVDYKAVCLQ
jgi:hypothetical protein